MRRVLFTVWLYHHVRYIIRYFSSLSCVLYHYVQHLKPGMTDITDLSIFIIFCVKK